MERECVPQRRGAVLLGGQSPTGIPGNLPPGGLPPPFLAWHGTCLAGLTIKGVYQQQGKGGPMTRIQKKALTFATLISLTLPVSGCIIGILDVVEDGSLSKVEVFDYQTFSLELGSQSLLQVEAINGTVRVRGASGADRLTVYATRRVRARSQSRAEERLWDLQIHVSKSSSVVFVETSHPPGGEDVTYIVDYDIIVPPDLEVEVIQANGEIRIEDLGADVWVENGNGNVTLDDLVGGAWVTVANGDVDSDIFLPYGKAIDQAVGNGGIKLRVQREVSAELSAQVGNGTISITGLTLFDQSGGPTALSGRLGSGAGFIGLSVGNGWIEIRGR